LLAKAILLDSALAKKIEERKKGKKKQVKTVSNSQAILLEAINARESQSIVLCIREVKSHCKNRQILKMPFSIGFCHKMRILLLNSYSA